MSIDPRTLSQLLQLQILGKLNLSASDANSSINTEDTSFNDLLQSMLSQSFQDQTDITNQSNLTSNQLASGSFGFYPPALSTPTAYDPLIKQASAQYGIDASLVKAVVNAESSFQSHAVSSSGAKGLMQLMDDTARGLGVTDSFDPQQNIQGGTRYLSDLLRNYNGSESMALAAYNGGSGRLARLGITNEDQLYKNYDQLPQETQRYIQKVLQLKNDY